SGQPGRSSPGRAPAHSCSRLTERSVRYWPGRRVRGGTDARPLVVDLLRSGPEAWIRHFQCSVRFGFRWGRTGEDVIGVDDVTTVSGAPGPAGAGDPQPVLGRRFEGKVAVVPGASRGIGLAIATRLVAEGARVCVTARKPEPLSAAVDRLGGPAVAVGVA